MDTTKFCQSCSMPLEHDEMRGTEKDGSKSNEYCKYCYTNGAFIHPNMKVDEMEAIVKTQMQKRKIPENIIQMAVNILPELKRWSVKATA